MKKFYINAEISDKPFGGGLKFARNLYDYLRNKGFRLAKSLDENDIDYIVNVSYFKYIYQSSPYSYLDTYNYKIKTNPNCKIITRINNQSSNIHGSVDETKHFVKSFKYSDKIVFISEFTKKEFHSNLAKYFDRIVVIKNSINKKFFFPKKNIKCIKKGKFKIVTHHWSPNYQKGHKLYQKLDKALNNAEIRKKFEFLYIGNVPKNLKYKNMKIISPKKDAELGKILRSCDIYITGTLNEAAGMHHIEAAGCGLPILYINSGALREYCYNYGLEIDYNNFMKKIFYLKSNYNHYKNNMKKFNNYDHQALKKYLETFAETKNKSKVNYFLFKFEQLIYIIENFKEIVKRKLKNIFII
jgi:hypothetical protein